MPEIRAAREKRGWTQQQVADQLARLAWLRDQKRVGINFNMVSAWERGTKGVSPLYQHLLVLLFEELQETHTDRPAIATRPDAPDHDEPLTSALNESARVFDLLGPAGGILQPRMFELWKDDIVQRRMLLKIMALAPTTLALPASTESPRRADAAGSLDDLEYLADRYQALYHSTAPNALIAPVTAHLDTIRDLLREGQAPAVQRQLLANRARVATLAGRLAFFDLQDTTSARSYYSLALESARGAGDHLQAAAALGHTAFIPAAEHSFSAALDYLHGAAQHVSRRPHAAVSSWLSAVESEIHTNAGQPTAALRAIEAAHSTLNGAPGLQDELAWLDYYDDVRLAGFAGYANLKARRLDDSRTALTAALTQLPAKAAKQRAVFLTDLATVELQAGNLDQACHMASEAATQLHQAGYAIGAGRLHEFRIAVRPWGAALPVRTLDEHLATLA